ncbi:hypothetical protein FF2_034960 [Malus domestica]
MPSPPSDCDSRNIRPQNQSRAPHAQAAVRVRSAGKNQKTTNSEDHDLVAFLLQFGGKSEDDGDTERCK